MPQRVRVALNGRDIGELSWDGRAEVVQPLRLPATALRAADNQLVLQVPVRHSAADAKNPVVDVVMFNRAEVSYPALGDLDRDAGAVTAAGNGSLPLRHAGAAPVSRLRWVPAPEVVLV